MNPTSGQPTSTTLTARSPEDLLAIAPVMLGFWPEESIVMMTLGADHSFHARVDLPSVADQTLAVRRELEEALLAPARRLRASHVVLLYFTADHEAAASVHRILRRACRRSQIDVITALHADGERFQELTGGAVGAPRQPYDVSAHPFVVEAMVAGRITHDRRADLVASLESDPAAAQRVRTALCASGLVEAGPATGGRSILAQGQWVEGLVSELAASGREASDDEVARLLWVMQSVRVRDAAWSLIEARTAQAHVRMWSTLLARVPDELAAAPAALLGWASWQAGDGARAWVAVDRCLRADPDYVMAMQLGGLLHGAVPPEHWEGGFDWSLGLPRSG